MKDGGSVKKKCTFRRAHFLPYEDVVDHGASAEHDAEADEDRRDDRRRRVELDECVQNHACGSHKYRINIAQRYDDNNNDISQSTR